MWNGRSGPFLLRQLASSRRGVAALEFALVGMAFLTMTLFAMDMGLQLYIQSIMDDAARSAAHNIKTGNGATAAGVAIGTARPTAADVRKSVCSLLSLATTNCTTSLQVYAANSTKFAALSRIDSPTTGLGTNNNVYSAGSSNAYVLLQVAFKRVSVIPFSSFANTYVVSTIMFENEL